MAPFAFSFALPLLAASVSFRASKKSEDRSGHAAGNATGVPLHPDAVTMNSWVFLKESMTQIRSQVQSLLTVKDDVTSLRKDLQTQEGLWHAAEADMKRENDQLARQVAALRQQVKAGESTWSEVEQLRRQLADEQRHSEQLRLEAQHERQRIELEDAFFRQRRDNLSAIVRIVNTSVQQEVMQAHDRQLQLETDGVALQLKATELKQRLKNGNEDLQNRKKAAMAEIGDVQRQLAGMRDGLHRLQAALGHAGSLDAQKAEMAKVQVELEHEVSLMVSVQQEQAKIIGECKVLHTARHDAACAEEKKAELRAKEAKELCGPVRGQMVALQQVLAECRLETSRGYVAPPEAA